jgi:[acyl-carrier-protein] S-malonyltransferase
MKFAFVFPGQGSQTVGMMAGYGQHSIVRDTFAEASQALGRDLWQMASEGPVEAINLTVNTQPLMLTAGIACFRLWQRLGGQAPALVAGHSLGEYSALVAAGALNLADAVKLVEIRARAMQAAVPSGTGAMAAVMGLDADIVRAVCADMAQGEVLEAVNFNEPMQTVIAGHVAAVQRAADEVKARGAKRALMLPVSAPFHCALMQPAADRLAEVLPGVAVKAPEIAVINNVNVETVSDPEQIKAALIRQAAAPVRWVETMRRMQTEGVTHVFECGPGKVLTGLVKRCAPTLQGFSMSNEEGVLSSIALTTQTH